MIYFPYQLVSRILNRQQYLILTTALFFEGLLHVTIVWFLALESPLWSLVLKIEEATFLYLEFVGFEFKVWHNFIHIIYTYIHTYIHTFIYIYSCMSIFMYSYSYWNRFLTPCLQSECLQLRIFWGCAPKLCIRKDGKTKSFCVTSWKHWALLGYRAAMGCSFKKSVCRSLQPRQISKFVRLRKKYGFLFQQLGEELSI